MTKKTIFLVIILFFAIFFYGMTVGLYKIFPYEYLNIVNDSIFDENVDNYQNNTLEFTGGIGINNENELNVKKKKLINYVWKSDDIPTLYPELVEKNINDKRFNDLTNLEQIDKISITMKHDVDSIVYLFQPKQSINELVLYHQGHSGGFINGKTTIGKLLDSGYTVAAFSMPLIGMNNQPNVEIENLGLIKIVKHDQFSMLEEENFSSMYYFLNPVSVTLNYIDDNYDLTNYHMVGISGGGWTTTLYSAIDNRISKSFSVAGSIPLSLRAEKSDVGDYEQFNSEFYKIANYVELYIMSSYGENREFIQIFNKFDSCCFGGTPNDKYEKEIHDIILKLGSGSFQVIIDETHNEHKISDYALEHILNRIP